MKMFEDNICCDTCYDPSDDICKLVREGWDKFSRHMSIFFKQLCESNNCCTSRWEKSNIECMLCRSESDIDVIIDIHDVPDIHNTDDQYKEYIYNDTAYCFTSPINIEKYSVCGDGDKLCTEEIETYNMSNINQRKKIVYTLDETSSSDCSENDSYSDYSSQDMSSSISSDELYNDTQHATNNSDEKIDKNNAYVDYQNIGSKTMDDDKNSKNKDDVNVNNVNNDNELTDNDKFVKNLKNNLLILSELEEGYKLWIEEETQRLYIDSTIGQAITRRLYGQGKAKTLEFIKRMIDTAELQGTPEHLELLDRAKIGVKNLTNTYKKSAWFGKYPEVDELEKIIDEKGWNRDNDGKEV